MTIKDDINKVKNRIVNKLTFEQKKHFLVEVNFHSDEKDIHDYLIGIIRNTKHEHYVRLYNVLEDLILMYIDMIVERGHFGNCELLLKEAGITEFNDLKEFPKEVAYQLINSSYNAFIELLWKNSVIHNDEKLITELAIILWNF